MSQQLLMEADVDRFIFNERYFKAVSRQSYESEKALDLKLIQKGQLIPIIVNSKMVILDGYTRWQLLGDRGKMIKYVIMDFLSEQDEYEFVIETNVMRRQLNDFQRAEAMFELYQTKRQQRKEDRTDKNYNLYLDLLGSIKDKDKKLIEISKELGKNKDYLRQTLTRMVEQYYVRSTKISKKMGKHAIHENEYKILPKGVGFLETQKRREMGSTDFLVGKIIGISRTSVQRSNYIINHADDVMLQQLRDNSLTIGSAYNLLTVGTRNNIFNRNIKYQCPHCNHIAKIGEYNKITQA